MYISSLWTCMLIICIWQKAIKAFIYLLTYLYTYLLILKLTSIFSTLHLTNISPSIKQACNKTTYARTSNDRGWNIDNNAECLFQSSVRYKTEKNTLSLSGASVQSGVGSIGHEKIMLVDRPTVVFYFNVENHTDTSIVLENTVYHILTSHVQIGANYSRPWKYRQKDAERYSIDN